MILDERNEFADAASVTGTANSTVVLGDVIDLGDAPTLQDLGNGGGVYLVITVDTTVAASGGASNLTFKLVSDSTANLATSPTLHFSTGAIAKGSLTAGALAAAVALPYGSYERYLGVTYTPDTNDVTAGKVNAFLTRDVARWTAYPNAANA